MSEGNIPVPLPAAVSDANSVAGQAVGHGANSDSSINNASGGENIVSDVATGVISDGSDGRNAIQIAQPVPEFILAMLASERARSEEFVAAQITRLRAEDAEKNERKFEEMRAKIACLEAKLEEMVERTNGKGKSVEEEGKSEEGKGKGKGKSVEEEGKSEEKADGEAHEEEDKRSGSYHTLKVAGPPVFKPKKSGGKK